MIADHMAPEMATEFLYDNTFTKDPVYHKAWDLLNRKNYWESGNYRMKMLISTSSPDRIFSKEWTFSLNKEEFEALRLNAVATLREICLRKVEYLYAFPQYTEITPLHPKTEKPG